MMQKMNDMKFWKFIPLFAIILLFSCSKNSLTIEPENRSVPGEYYNSAQRIQQAVIGGYVDLRRALFANYAWLMYGEVRAGEMNAAVPYVNFVMNQELVANNKNVSELSDWGYFYDVIKDANDVLDIVASSDDDMLSAYQRNLFKGEALALKSITYFYLARIWGVIPSAEKNNFGKQLSNQEAVALAAQMASEAQKLLPWLLVNDDGIESAALSAVRFNKTAVTSLLAQEELWLGNGQKAYDLLNNTFTEATADSLSAFGISIGEDRRTSIPQTPMSSSIVRLPLDKLNTIYPDGDTRRGSMFTISAADNIASLIVRDASIVELLPRREINLLFAEAAWKSGQIEDAKDYLIKVSGGATEDYSALTEATFGDALLQERQRILMGTGQRFFDLIRFDKVSSYIPVFDDDDVTRGAAYWPLSANSVKGNSLSQNSFWANP